MTFSERLAIRFGPLTRSPQARYGLGAVLVLLGSAGFSAKAVLIRMAYHYPVDSLTLLTL
ncbi:MAG: hypothetical protein H7Y12_09665, partial [Sphingobacteriaceae bacterium]|nr:hypothetical protein [Cytophagaceae bacterium]